MINELEKEGEPLPNVVVECLKRKGIRSNCFVKRV